MTRPGATPIRGSRRAGLGEHRRLVLASLLGVLLLSGMAATVPGSGAALSAALTNTDNTATTRTFFSCAAAITAAVPRVYYKLDETTTATTAVDSSGQGRNGTYQGSTTKGGTDACARDPGTSVAFNGTTGYVNLSSSLSVPTTYSTEAWLNTTSATGGLITGFGASPTGASLSTDRVLYMTSSGAVAFGTNTLAKTTITAAGPYNDGKWHHVLATLGTNGMRIYVDGKQAATSTTTATAAYTGYFRVGYDTLSGWTPTPTTNFFKGSLDEVAVYSTTLTATDAANHYQAGT